MQDFESLTAWSESEISQQFIDFIIAVATILDCVDEEIETIKQNDLDEPVIERMIRDVKAAGFNRIDSIISDFT